MKIMYNWIFQFQMVKLCCEVFQINHFQVQRCSRIRSKDNCGNIYERAAYLHNSQRAQCKLDANALCFQQKNCIQFHFVINVGKCITRSKSKSEFILRAISVRAPLRLIAVPLVKLCNLHISFTQIGRRWMKSSRHFYINGPRDARSLRYSILGRSWECRSSEQSVNA